MNGGGGVFLVVDFHRSLDIGVLVRILTPQRAAFQVEKPVFPAGSNPSNGGSTDA